MKSKSLTLVLVAMVMFAAGVFVFAVAKDSGEHVLGGIAILGALAVVVNSLWRNGE